MTWRRLFIHIGLTIFLALSLSSHGVLAGGGASTSHQPLTAVESEPAQFSEIQAVLWDQTSPLGVDAHRSSDEAGTDDIMIADDFVATVSGATQHSYWQVTAVQVIGRYTGKAQASSVKIQFYTDLLSSGVHIPGTLVYNQTVNTTLVSGTATINLPAPVLLSAATPITYWVAVQSGAATSGVWLWTEHNDTQPYSGTSPSVAIGQGIDDVDCKFAWGRRLADCNIPPSGTKPDMVFAILGSKVTFTDFIRLPLIMR